VQLGIPIYTVTLYFGAVVGIILGTEWAAVHGLAASKVCAAMILLLFPALVGARLLFVALHWNAFRRHPQGILRHSQTGAAMYGGLFFALAFSVPLLAMLWLDWWRFWDAGAIAMLIGMIFTKFGCLWNGCCTGRMMQTRRGGGRFPSQVMEAWLAIIVLLLSMWGVREPRPGGFLFLSALAGYGVGRWLLEPARETVDRIRGISVNRAISACLVVLATSAFLFLTR
jgi:phosphatidylglycerol---prolipoprotein diacylglyceryl transferase